MFTGQPPVFPFSKEKTMPRKIIETPQLSSPGQRLRQNLNRQSAGAPRGNQLSAPGQRLRQRFTKPVQVGTPQKPGLPTTGTGVAPGIKAPPSVTTGGGIKSTGTGTRTSRKPIGAMPSGGLQKVGGNGTKPTPSPTRQPRRERTRPRGER